MAEDTLFWDWRVALTYFVICVGVGPYMITVEKFAEYNNKPTTDTTKSRIYL